MKPKEVASATYWEEMYRRYYVHLPCCSIAKLKMLMQMAIFQYGVITLCMF